MVTAVNRALQRSLIEKENKYKEFFFIAYISHLYCEWQNIDQHYGGVNYVYEEKYGCEQTF